MMLLCRATASMKCWCSVPNLAISTEMDNLRGIEASNELLGRTEFVVVVVIINVSDDHLAALSLPYDGLSGISTTSRDDLDRRRKGCMR